MTILKFVTKGFGTEIKEMEVLRETENSVFVSGYKGEERRRAKSSDYENYHDSWEQARDFLWKHFEGEVNVARHRLEIAKGALGNVKGMKKPNAA